LYEINCTRPQTSPNHVGFLASDTAFGSTYAREAAFDDDAWISRIVKPTVTTFVAVSEKDGGRRQIVSSLTLVVSESNNLRGVMRWDVNAVYTLPEARGRGIASAVMAAAKEFASAEAAARGRDWALMAVVLSTNAEAQSLYEKLGFKEQSFARNGIMMVLTA
jgi:ribosomal protein S18 acetylase RimI-like enzyme